MRLITLLLLSIQLLIGNPTNNNSYKENLLRTMADKIEIDETIIIGTQFGIEMTLEQEIIKNNIEETETKKFQRSVQIQKILDTKENAKNIKESFIKLMKDFYSLEELKKREYMEEIQILERIAKDSKEVDLMMNFSRVEMNKLLLNNLQSIEKILK